MGSSWAARRAGMRPESRPASRVTTRAAPRPAPRSTLPVLIINGRNDLLLPLETSVRPSFALQGAPDEHKRLVVLEGGHIPSNNNVIREVLDWLDRYLGPVESSDPGNG